jgi:hypothetical protein
MSQHTYITKHQGRPITIQMGWDRPLQGFHMVIWYMDQSSDDDQYLYSNLEDMDLPAAQPSSLDPFLQRLIQLGIEVPSSMVALVHLDGEANTGNSQTAHTKFVRINSAFQGVSRTGTEADLVEASSLTLDLVVKGEDDHPVLTLPAPQGGWSIQELKQALLSPTVLDLNQADQELHAYLGNEWLASNCFD